MCTSARALIYDAQFFQLICEPDFNEALFENAGNVPEIDDACGAGATDNLDLTAEGYLALIEDAISLMQPAADVSIPTADVEAVCEVWVEAPRDRRRRRRRRRWWCSCCASLSSDGGGGGHSGVGLFACFLSPFGDVNLR